MGSLPRSPAELYTSVHTATYKTKYNFRFKIKLTSTTLNVCKKYRINLQLLLLVSILIKSTSRSTVSSIYVLYCAIKTCWAFILYVHFRFKKLFAMSSFSRVFEMSLRAERQRRGGYRDTTLTTALLCWIIGIIYSLAVRRIKLKLQNASTDHGILGLRFTTFAFYSITMV